MAIDKEKFSALNKALPKVFVENRCEIEAMTLETWNKNHLSDNKKFSANLKVRNAKILERLDKKFEKNLRKQNIRKTLSFAPVKKDLQKEMQERIDALREKLDKAVSERSDIVEGFVYIIQNPSWPGWFKIGQTLNVDDRLRVYQTSSPLNDFSVLLSWWTSNRRLVEKELIDKFETLGYEVRSEWIKIDKKTLFEILRQ